jgi:hypothetical protein
MTTEINSNSSINSSSITVNNGHKITTIPSHSIFTAPVARRSITEERVLQIFMVLSY